MFDFWNDRTFCGNKDCERKDCYRHQCHVVGNPRFLSLAMFEGTEMCLKEKESKCEGSDGGVVN